MSNIKKKLHNQINSFQNKDYLQLLYLTIKLFRLNLFSIYSAVAYRGSQSGLPLYQQFFTIVIFYLLNTTFVQ